MSDATLHRLLDANLQLPPEYRGGFSNHLPMALQALHALGAPAQRMQAFFDHYLAHFDDRSAPAAAAAPADWLALRGRGDAFASLLAGFSRAIDDEGVDPVLRTALPALLPGVAAVAFHGLIRTAHAIESGHRGELAAALAYWACRWQPLAPAPAGQPMDFDDWAKALVEQALGWTGAGASISLRMAQATDSAPYLALAGRLRQTDDLLARASAFAAERYAATGNFTVLHMVTGLRAIRIVGRWAGDAGAPILANAVTAAYLAAKVGAAAQAPPARAPGWDEVVVAAIASDDEHVIKLVHACRDQQAAFGAGPWLDAARRAVR